MVRKVLRVICCALMPSCTTSFAPHFTGRGRITRMPMVPIENNSPSPAEPWVPKRPKAMFRSVNPVDMRGVDDGDTGDNRAWSDEVEEAADDEDVSYDSYDAYRDDYGVAGSTLREVSHDYGVPLEFLVSSACQLGLPPPVDCDARLSSLLGGQQIFALAEALTTLDPAEARDRFSDQSLAETADHFGVSLVRIFEACADLGLSVPFGVLTHLRTFEQQALVAELEKETGRARLVEGPPGAAAKRRAQAFRGGQIPGVELLDPDQFGG